MGIMKNFLTALFVMAFLINALAVTAWAKPCMVNDQQVVGNVSDMPCHEKGKKKSEKEMKHCEDICLCSHVLLHQTPILSDILSLSFQYQKNEKINITEERLVSLRYSPPRRPPKLFI